MSILDRPMTYDDLRQLPDDGFRHEIVDGVLFMSPAPSKKHQKLSARLFLILGPHVQTAGLGEVYYAPVDVHLRGDRIVQPDMLFIRNDRLHIFGPNGVEGAPDLVVEIRSPSSRIDDLSRKAQLYEEAGVREYWVADPEEQWLRVFVLRGGRYEEVFPENGILRSTVLPDLRVDLAALFANLG